jgi:AraC family transcriptional regulator of adaptative response/methylated-DNA-[protein]-cysteine methyltransferase
MAVNDSRPKKRAADTGPETTPELIRYGFGQTTVGAILVALSDAGIVAIIIREHPDNEALVSTLQARLPEAELQHDRAQTETSVEAVRDFIERPGGNIRGTVFRRRVW